MSPLGLTASAKPLEPDNPPQKSDRGEYRIRLFERMVILGSMVVAIFTLVHYMEEMYALVAFNLPILLINLLNLILLRHHQRVELAIGVMLSTVMVLLMATAMLGGIDNSGILWLPIYPILVFLLKGQQGGIYWVIFYNLMVFLLFVVEQMGFDLTPHEAAFVFHVFISTLVMTLLLYIYEGLRQQLVDELELERIRAEAASSAKSQFLANMSHEIRTPMNGIIGLNNIMLRGELPEESRHHAELIRTSSETLMGLIDDVLDISKIEAHKFDLAQQSVELGKLIDELMGLLQPGADAKALNLKCHLVDEIPERVMLDPLRLRQILLNMIGNAIKFTRDGEVSLNIEISNGDDASKREVIGGWGGSLLHFAIKDSGIGIPHEKIETIFEQFSQADSTLSRQYGGSGLGLNISRELAGIMGGRVSVESELGKGSIFHLYLPLIAAESETKEVVDLSQLPEQFDLDVLVAEDDRINRLVVTKFLTDLGCRVECVENGAEAVDAVKSGKHDLVLMDLHMPQMDGRRATEEIRKQESSDEHIPIIALTANVISGEREACIAVGMDDFVMKPLKPERLREILADYDTDSGM